MNTPQTKEIPVLLGSNNRHVMGTAETLETENDFKVIVSVTATGQDALDLIAIMNSEELVAVQFVAIPVTPRSTPS